MLGYYFAAHVAGGQPVKSGEQMSPAFCPLWQSSGSVATVLFGQDMRGELLLHPPLKRPGVPGILRYSLGHPCHY